MPSEKQIEAFARYRRKQIAELRPYIEGEDVSHVSISPEDVKAGSPKRGDMIARNPKNHDDQWLVARAYFLDNFEALTAAEQAEPTPTTRSGAVKVKPLEWSTTWGTIKAETGAGHYFIEDNRDGGFSVRLESIWRSWASSIEAAKATAQADYERRILSALEPAEPAPDVRYGAVKVKELMCDFEDFINQPPQYEDQRMVRDYRHELYRKWEPLCRLILAALEPAEPATDAEREFNEVLKGAEDFNDALPERMRRNARDWLCPDDKPATDAEPVATVYRKGNVTGQLVWTKVGEHADLPDGANLYTRPPESRLREALEFYADSENWKQNGPLDPNSGNFTGGPARAALAQEGGR